jgi:hypothetical protein
MKNPTITSTLLILLAGLPQGWADAELRLYQGNSDAELREVITISTTNGAITDQIYKKVCTAYNGCRSVPDGPALILTPITSRELSTLKNALARHNPNASKKSKTPKKPSICEYFGRMSYQASAAGGPHASISEFNQCSGDGANTPQADTIETILNSAASNAGL